MDGMAQLMGYCLLILYETLIVQEYQSMSLKCCHVHGKTTRLLFGPGKYINAVTDDVLMYIPLNAGSIPA
jgi:hypothetical protein